jgi:hypothetical protein
MGTVGYMSPEQAVRQALDFRSDQFSFGSVLYEMATGKRAFSGNTKPETLAAIIREEPEPIGTLNPKIPPPLRWIVERCLAKDPKERYASTEDLARDLASVRDHLSEVASSAESPVVLAPPPRRRAWIPSLIVVAVVVALGITAWSLRRSGFFWRNPLAEAHFTRLTDWEGSELDAAISGDGKFVAFLSDRDGPFDAWVGQIGSGEFLNLTKGRYPTLANPIVHSVGFSGDEAHVWFRVNSKDGKTHSVLLVPTIGGTPRLFRPRDTPRRDGHLADPLDRRGR